MVQSPWSPELTGLGLSFMLALCMALGFDGCWVFLWWVLPFGWLAEGHSIHHLLYSVVQVWAGCVEASSSMCTRFWGFSLALVQLFVLSKFLHHLVVFPDRSYVELVWLPLPPSLSSVVICWWFLCWWVSSSSRYPGVYSFHLLFPTQNETHHSKDQVLV